VRAVLLGAAGAAVLLSGCTIKNSPDNMVNGKTAFIQKCGACHVLARAGTTGVTGPDLDQAFQQAVKDGFGRSTFKGVVKHQIGHPARMPQLNPQTGEETTLMPANLVSGKTAYDVAAYVADVAAKKGEDTGRLATVGNAKSTAVAKEVNGTLDIPADPTGALAYKFGAATANAGSVKIESKNDAPIDHDIAVEGNGVDEHGAVVKGGGVSTITVDLKPGTYTFYCSVPGHREGGMEGKITVK
jgi:uncharacterized cupredoxin-like copper-binding protein